MSTFSRSLPAWMTSSGGQAPDPSQIGVPSATWNRKLLGSIIAELAAWERPNRV